MDRNGVTEKVIICNGIYNQCKLKNVAILRPGIELLFSNLAFSFKVEFKWAIIQFCFSIDFDILINIVHSLKFSKKGKLFDATFDLTKNLWTDFQPTFNQRPEKENLSLMLASCQTKKLGVQEFLNDRHLGSFCECLWPISKIHCF